MSGRNSILRQVVFHYDALILTLPTRQDLSHDDVIDIVALDASARHRVLNNNGDKSIAGIARLNDPTGVRAAETITTSPGILAFPC